jgi:hypothetical protein
VNGGVERAMVEREVVIVELEMEVYVALVEAIPAELRWHQEYKDWHYLALQVPMGGVTLLFAPKRGE